MKTRWNALVLALLSWQASAQDAGMYEALRYRMDDPFVFCTYGQRNDDKCWIPTDHLGGWMFNLPAFCDPPFYFYGKQWTSADVDSLIQYGRVCPNARQDGSWGGQGDPQDVPVSH
ncbi:MAG: hypothetical protein QM601_13960 [Pseudoxanthomonas sp.]